VTNHDSHRHDFLPTASLENLRLRDALLRQLRGFFHQRDFFEVTTPTLSRDTVVDRHLDPFVARPHGQSRDSVWFLQTSPEFHMKRLLVGGAQAIFQICPAYRVGESGPLHNPEFTIVEWYRRGDDLQAGIGLLSELIHGLLDFGPATSISYREVFERYVRLDPMTSDLDALRTEVSRPPVTVNGGYTAPDPSNWDHDACLEWLFLDRVQGHLQRPSIVYDYPPGQAALAQVRRSGSEPPVAERFELFVRGMELANGYHELRDASELARRASKNNELRRADGKSDLPASSRLLAAMQHGLPACAGVALGFDRLAMLAANCQSIDQIMPFPVEIA
jgi:lysyl-tRNA synthetase class 2